MHHKVKEWVKRYLPAEIISVVTTIIPAIVVYRLTGNLVATAFAGTWGGNIGYFGFIIRTDIFATNKQLRADGQVYTFSTLLKNIRALFVEFGVAELLDSFVIRPSLMYCLPLLVGSVTWGIVLAKVIADITFYIPVILGYEVAKKHYK